MEEEGELAIEEDPSKDEEPPMEEEDSKEDLAEEEMTLIEEDNLRKELMGIVDNGVEPREGRSEPKTVLFPWR